MAQMFFKAACRSIFMPSLPKAPAWWPGTEEGEVQLAGGSGRQVQRLSVDLSPFLLTWLLVCNTPERNPLSG